MSSDLPEAVPRLRLFEGYGIELEYMIVQRESLDVLPISDRLLLPEGRAEPEAEIERGRLAWSNELVLHVIELKTNGPAPSLEGLGAAFAADVRAIDELLAPEGARLMPTAMHPWMDPLRETRLWPHEYGAVYRTFDRIFDCRGHGWSNLQSMHINLPYQGDHELARLHTAIRLALPLIPALAASSPFVEGRATGLLDNRLELYRHNCRAIPSVTGRVVPELARSEAEYRERILERIGRDIAAHDPDRLLDPEWVNARGSIVRFVRDSIEIRVIDIQEQPAADLAVAALIAEVVRALVEQRWSPTEEQERFTEEELEALLLETIRHGERARIREPRLLRCFGVQAEALHAGLLWQQLAEQLMGDGDPAWREPLAVIFERGPLARRILAAQSRGRELADIYRELCECLHRGASFLP